MTPLCVPADCKRGVATRQQPPLVLIPPLGLSGGRLGRGSGSGGGCPAEALSSAELRTVEGGEAA